MKQKTFLSSATLKGGLKELTRAMFSLHSPKELWAVLNRVGWQAIVVCLGRKRKITSRVRRLFALAAFVVKMSHHHGESFAITWLKTAHIAVQRAIAGTPVKSLREITPGLPLPRVSNGLPVIIGPSDRMLIRKGDATVIRLWLTFFSLFRILSGPLKPALNTITDPYSGSPEAIDHFEQWARAYFLRFIDNFKLPLVKKVTASFDNIPLSRSAGPNVSMAFLGILQDSLAWHESPLLKVLTAYADLTKSKDVLSLLSDTYRIALSLSETTILRTFTNKRTKVVSKLLTKVPLFAKISTLHGGRVLGSLSFKEEAAGKLRVFAIADIYTQWLMKPLHVGLFALLNKLPMDATFDQDAGLKRIAEIAVREGCAYSFDLSAATDRLPVAIQAVLLSLVTGKSQLGKLWAQLLVARGWRINENPYGLPTGNVSYAVGQPMGALSSWAMLALTHHVLVQFSAFRAGYPNLNFTSYCVLGDDIVIADKAVAMEYLKVMRELGVSINLSKSLLSETKPPVLEFAKRTVLGNTVVSGLSFKQLTTARTLAARVQNVLYFGALGLVKSHSVLCSILARFGSDVQKPMKKVLSSLGFQYGLLGILGSLSRRGFIPLEYLVEACANPRDEEFDWNEKTYSLPSAQAMSLLMSYFEGRQDLGYPWSAEEQRIELREDIMPSISEDLLLLALKQRKATADRYDSELLKYAETLVTGPTVFGLLKEKDPVLASQLLSLAELVVLGNKDPTEFYEELYEILADDRHEPLPVEQAMAIAEKSIHYDAAFSVEPVRPRAYARDEAWIMLRLVKAGWCTPRIWSNLEIVPYPGWIR